MAVDGWRELGPVTGACLLCGADGHLQLGEFRSRPDLRDRLRGVRCETTSRLVSCRVCGWRWSVRRDDDRRGASTVQGRTGAAAAATRPVRPAGQRGAGRPVLAQRVPMPADLDRLAPAPSRVPWPRACERQVTSATI